MPDLPQLQAPTARHIPAWGETPGSLDKENQRAESPTYKALALKASSLLGTVLTITSCSRNIETKVIQTPTTGLYFTEEIYRGRGAIDNDHTGLYLHLDRDGRSDKRLVLSGTYVELNRIIWASPSEATLCMQPGGATDEFRSLVPLSVKSAYKSVHFLLKEDC